MGKYFNIFKANREKKKKKKITSLSETLEFCSSLLMIFPFSKSFSSNMRWSFSNLMTNKAIS